MVRKFGVDDEEGSALKNDGTSCGNVREDLKECVLTSDCVRIHKISPKQCLIERHHGVPEECFQLRQLMYECKRSLLDPRARFRGRKGY